MRLFTISLLAVAIAADGTVNDHLTQALGGTRLCGFLTGDSVNISDTVELEAYEGCVFKWRPQHSGIINIKLQETERPLCGQGHMYIVTGGEVFGPYCDTEKRRKRRQAWHADYYAYSIADGDYQDADMYDAPVGDYYVDDYYNDAPDYYESGYYYDNSEDGNYALPDSYDYYDFARSLKTENDGNAESSAVDMSVEAPNEGQDRSFGEERKKKEETTDETYMENGQKVRVFRKHYAYNSDDLTEDDVEVIYTNDGGFKFRFHFNFEFELEPGNPEEYGEQKFYEHQYDPNDPYGPGKPAYSPPAYKPKPPAYMPENNNYTPGNPQYMPSGKYDPEDEETKPDDNYAKENTYGDDTTDDYYMMGDDKYSSGKDYKPDNSYKPDNNNKPESNYKPETNNYKPNNNNYKPSNNNYKPSNNNYKPDNNYKPSNNNYKPDNNNYKPSNNNYKPDNNNYKPSSNDYKPDNNNYKPSNNNYKPDNNNYKPSNNNYQTNTNNQYKPETNNYKPAGGYGKDPPLYSDYGVCPWWEKGHYGDCGSSYEQKCNLKYFRICGEHFFNKVYYDVCRWADAKQLIPMFTEKLVPLGNKFQNHYNHQCNGYGDRTMEDLYGRSLPDEEVDDRGEVGARDVPTCWPKAGSPPCELLDFSGVTNARQFHMKMEELYHKWLKNRCNREWRVHFEALLKRMRNSLFCDDGSYSDHEGYTASPPPPVYGSQEYQSYSQSYKQPYKPTKAPYKPTQPYKPPTQPPYKPPTQPPYKPPTQQQYKPNNNYKPSNNNYQSDNNNYKPAYKPPTQPPYKPPTQPPYKPPTQPYKPPTQPPYKPPTQPPYKPPTQPYKPPTQPPYKPSYKPPTQPPYKPPTQPPYKPPTQQQYKPNNNYKPSNNNYQSDNNNYKPAYKPPTQPPYQPPTQPPYKPPTQPPYKPPTQPYKPPTQPPYKPPTQPPYKPPTQPPYKPPTQPYKPPTQPPYKPSYKPTYKPDEGYRPTTDPNWVYNMEPVYTTKKPYTENNYNPPTYTTQKPYATSKPYTTNKVYTKPLYKPPPYKPEPYKPHYKPPTHTPYKPPHKPAYEPPTPPPYKPSYPTKNPYTTKKLYTPAPYKPDQYKPPSYTTQKPYTTKTVYKPSYKPDPYKPNSYKPEPYKPDPYKPDPYKPNNYQPPAYTTPKPYTTKKIYTTKPYKPDPYKEDPYKPVKYTPPKYTTPKPYTTKKVYTPAPYKPDPYKPAPYKPEPYKPDPYKPNNYKPPVYTTPKPYTTKQVYTTKPYKPDSYTEDPYKPVKYTPPKYTTPKPYTTKKVYTPAPYKPDSYKPDSYKPDPYKPNYKPPAYTTQKPYTTKKVYTPAPYKPDPYQPVQYKPEPYKPDSYKPNNYEPATYTTQKPYTTKPVYTTKKVYTPSPYKPDPYKPDPYKPDKNYLQPSYDPSDPYGESKYNKQKYEPYDGPAPVHGYCPWNAYSYDAGMKRYKHYDCPKQAQCSLKYIPNCVNNFFNHYYTKMCKWQEALSLMPMINKLLWQLGVRAETNYGVCNGPTKSSYGNDHYPGAGGYINRFKIDDNETESLNLGVLWYQPVVLLEDPIEEIQMQFGDVDLQLGIDDVQENSNTEDETEENIPDEGSSRKRRNENANEDKKDDQEDTKNENDSANNRGLSYVHKKPDGTDYVVPMCNPAGGMVPCNLVEFHLARNEKDFYERFAKLVRYVQRHCNDYWKTHTEALLARLQNAINCVEVTSSYKCGAYAELIDSGYYGGQKCECQAGYQGNPLTGCTQSTGYKPQTYKPDPYKPDPYKPNSYKPDLYKPTNYKPPIYTTPKPYTSKMIYTTKAYTTTKVYTQAPYKPGPYKPGNYKPDPYKPADLYKPTYTNSDPYGKDKDPYKPAPYKPDSYKPNPYKPEPYKPEPYKPDSYKPGGYADECQKCGMGAKCSKDIYGNKTCVCKPGFKGDPYSKCVPHYNYPNSGWKTTAFDKIDPCENCSDDAVCRQAGYTGKQCVCKPGFEGDGSTCSEQSDACSECSENADCQEKGFPAVKMCICKKGFTGDGWSCDKETVCDSCSDDTTCVDGKCSCNLTGFDWNGETCVDKDECASETTNNCHEAAICSNTDGGFQCTCEDDYDGDGVTCLPKKNEAPPMPNQSAFGQSGTDISMYAELEAGQCSVMGYDWENLEKLTRTMQWSSNPKVFVNLVKQLFVEFASLGKAALARSVQQCDMRKAGVVPCKLLYFPHTEPRCQLVQRLNMVYKDIATHCNDDWKQNYGSKMQTLMQHNKVFKGKACPRVNLL